MSPRHYWYTIDGLVRFMVFNATFTNISVISWLSRLMVEETGENPRPVSRKSRTNFITLTFYLKFDRDVAVRYKISINLNIEIIYDKNILMYF
jgi:urease beta subunit